MSSAERELKHLKEKYDKICVSLIEKESSIAYLLDKKKECQIQISKRLKETALN